MEKSTLSLEDKGDITCFKVHTVIVGSGAAGLNCAQRLFNRGIKDVVIITDKLGGGTSNNSGSDKQTYYKMSALGDVLDSPLDMAHALFDGGMMHGDSAYIEALYSLPAFYHLVENGVPFPFNNYGAFVGYKTDHDPKQRATSAGPKTSMYMVKTFLEKIKDLDIPIFDKMMAVKLITLEEDSRKQVCGLVALDLQGKYGRVNSPVVFLAENVVMATGGPGELYGLSVYPQGQAGTHGLALQEGVGASNLTESQFGIGSTKFRWNLSGTYQQVIPGYFSMDKQGEKHNFLSEYFLNLKDMCSATFLKGYQWPFNAHNIDDFGSSLIDIAVDAEIKKGRKVYLDFARNPYGNGEIFDFSLLSKEAAYYLNRSQATQKSPYERLKYMNKDSIDIYAEHGLDLKDPLEIAVNFQHNNGGLAVNIWWESNLSHLFIIGEAAGTHGVRPGGSALNSGQVGGIRVAQYISNVYKEFSDAKAKGKAALNALKGVGEFIDKTSRNSSDSKFTAPQLKKDIQERMSCSAGFMRSELEVKEAAAEATKLWEQVQNNGINAPPDEIHSAFEVYHLTLTSRCFLESISDYIDNSGGSRGSFMIIDPQGNKGAECKKGRLFQYREENLALRKKIQNVSYNKSQLSISYEEVRPLPEDESWYETTWNDWKNKAIFRRRSGTQ